MHSSACPEQKRWGENVNLEVQSKEKGAKAIVYKKTTESSKPRKTRRAAGEEAERKQMQY